MALSTYLANKLLDHINGKTAFTMPTVYGALWVGSPTVTGTGGAEGAWTGAARVALPGASWNAASAAAATTSAAINFAAKTAGTDVTVTHFATWDASTGGNMLQFFALGTPQLISNGSVPAVPAGSGQDTAA